LTIFLDGFLLGASIIEGGARFELPAATRSIHVAIVTTRPRYSIYYILIYTHIHTYTNLGLFCLFDLNTLDFVPFLNLGVC
jgi:hypothetical protein